MRDRGLKGISGTSTKKRVEFNRMIEECMNGNIDMIVTKSVSRFARNTLDCLHFIRLLKERNVAIFFEKENVNTLDGKGEFLITLLGSLAQEESCNLSKVTRMGISYRFQSGKVLVNCTRFLGYTKDDKGDLKIDPIEAETVKRIYREYLLGYSITKIARGLERERVPNGVGNTKWWDSTIIKILKNEKYMGDAMLQKTVTVDFLTRKRVKNHGEAQKYYVEDSHPPIVSKEDYAAVQAEMAKRSNLRGYTKTGKCMFSSMYPFSGKIFCDKCGSKFRRHPFKTKMSNQVYWICINHQSNGDDACEMLPVNEKEIEDKFIKSLNRLVADKDDFLGTLKDNIRKGLSQVQQEFSLEEIEEQLAERTQEMMNLIRLNTKTGASATAYDNEYAELAEEIELLRDRKAHIKNEDTMMNLYGTRLGELETFLVQQSTPLNSFDDDLFRRIVDHMVVNSGHTIRFVFKCGLEMTEQLRPKRKK